MTYGRPSNNQVKCNNRDLLVKAVIDNDIDNVLKLTKIIPESEWQSTIFSIPTNNSLTIDETKKSSRSILPETELSLLHIAAFEDSLEAFILLNRISLTIQSAESYLPIHYACSNGSKEVLTYILSIDPSQAVTNYSTEYNLLQLATRANSPDILKILFDYGAKLNTKTTNAPMDPISISIRSKNVECLKILLKHTSDSLKMYQNMTPIMVALVNNKPDAVPLLIDAKVDLGFINSEYQTALSIACFQNQKEIVKLICAKLDNIDLPPEYKAPGAVHWLCQSKDPEIAEIMLAKNIDVNRIDNDGYVGPHYLLDSVDASSIIKFLELLVKAGFKIDCAADKNTFLGECVTSIHVHSDVVEWLLEHGANIHAPLRAQSYGLTIAQYIIDSLKKPDQSTNLKLLKKIAQKWLPEEYESAIESSK